MWKHKLWTKFLRFWRDNGTNAVLPFFNKTLLKEKAAPCYCINSRKYTFNNSNQRDLYHCIIMLVCTKVNNQAIKITFRLNKSTHFYKSPRQTDRLPFADRLLNWMLTLISKYSPFVWHHLGLPRAKHACKYFQQASCSYKKNYFLQAWVLGVLRKAATDSFFQWKEKKEKHLTLSESRFSKKHRHARPNPYNWEAWGETDGKSLYQSHLSWSGGEK